MPTPKPAFKPASKPAPKTAPVKSTPIEDYELQQRLYAVRRNRVLAKAESAAAWRQVMAYEGMIADLNREELEISKQIKQQ